MAATKLQFKYGQWSKEQAIEMSKVAGVVVYSGKTKGIYVDGKEFVSGESSDKDFQNVITMLGAVKNEETGLYELSNLTNLPTDVQKDVTSVLNSLTKFRADMHVDEYAQAEIKPVKGATRSEDATKLTIFGIGQGVAGGDNDGKIYVATETPSDDINKETASTSLVINIAGEYRPTETGEGEDKLSRNWIATEHTVDAAVKGLRAEIFGTLDPKELDKTIDSIKEIQEVLKGGNFVEWTHEEVNPETGKTETKADNVRVLPATDEEGNPVYVLAKVDKNGIPVKDENGNYIPTDKVVVSYNEDGETVYADGYSNLQETQNVQELLNDIENIENAELVNEVLTEEVKATSGDKAFTYTTKKAHDADENGLITSTYTIGVKYGTFAKIESDNDIQNIDTVKETAIDGIATVKDIQDYIESRLCWAEFVADVDVLVAGINNIPGTKVEVEVKDNARLAENIVIK